MPAPAEPRPLFVIGSYRSGTSILTWCLGQHPNIWAIPETYWLARYALAAERFYALGTIQPQAHFNATKFSQDQFTRALAEAVQNVVVEANIERLRHFGLHDRDDPDPNRHFALRRRLDEPKQRWVDGTPENAHYVFALRRLFPQARFIHIFRDPREVVRSLAHFDKVGGAKKTEEEAYQIWLRLVRAAIKAERAFGSEVVTRVRYRDFVDDPRQVIAHILSFVGEEFSEDCMKPLQAEKINSSAVDNLPIPASQIALGQEAAALFDELNQTLSASWSADDKLAAELETQFRNQVAKHCP